MTAIIQGTFKTALTFALLGIAICLLLGSLAAQTFDYSVIHSFGAPRMGILLTAPVLLDNKGRLYGAAKYGGTFGYGLIYEISATGVERPIYSFTGGSDGANPHAGLISDPDGNLYGVTEDGGDLTCYPPYGCGTVFELDTFHKFSVLHVFTGNEGFAHYSALVRDGSGNLYGSSLGGDSNSGTVFKLDPQGNLTWLYQFSRSDGGSPDGLIIDALGNLYGTTVIGGTYDCGTIFKLDPAGHISILHNFSGGSDGAEPYAALTRDSDGNLYGVTNNGGDPSCGGGLGCGTLFKLNLQTRTETILHVFTGGDGQNPTGNLLFDSAGNLYGTASNGGSYGVGVVFMLDANGVYSILHEFSGPDGADPFAGLIMDRAGDLYGTTFGGGGTNFQGTVYKLTLQ